MKADLRTIVVGDAGDLSAPPGSRPWAVAMKLHLLTTYQKRDDEENHLRLMRDGFLKYQGWSVLVDADGQPFSSWDEFCRTPSPYGLGTTPEHLDDEVERRKLLTPHEAGKLGGRGKKGSSNTTGFNGERGRDYFLAKLEKDGERELLAKIHSGQMSASAAAIEAGIRPRYLQVAPTVDGFLKAALKHLSTRERRELKRKLS